MYDGKRFQSISNTVGGDVGAATVFQYRQDGDLVWATYEGGGVRFGTLVARVSDEGTLDMRYQHLSVEGDLKTGTCTSRPERLADGRLRLHESWRWTSGGEGHGTSVIEELPPLEPPERQLSGP